MDVFNHLGELALGSRLKRLSDQIMRDGSKIYQDSGIDFEPRWFPVFYSISKRSPRGVTEIAKDLGISHAAVSQVVRELLKKGLLEAVKDELDGRRRLLSLSVEGQSLLPDIQEVWNDISEAIHQMINEHQANIIDCIREVERSFEKSSLHQRVAKITQDRCMDQVDIVEYQSRYKAYFKKLNYDWIRKYFELEEMDEVVLTNPDQIIKDGGAILFAKLNNRVVGTCALIKIDNETYELAKMAVAEEYQGRHIGKKLGLSAIEKSVQLGAKKLMLESNKKLIPALNLYRKLGFIPVCSDHHKSMYQRANITMQMTLQT
jgi:DNA-binding MarR family transcriptional regulator/GNAT superfamily N-acetyltransferase